MVAGEDCLVASDYFRDHHSVSYVAVMMIEEAGAEILLSGGVSDVIMGGHKATGLFVENKSGTLAIKSKERVYIYGFAVFLRAHVPGFEETTLHVVAPLTCSPGRQEHRPDVATGADAGSQRQAEDLSPLPVQAHQLSKSVQVLDSSVHFYLPILFQEPSESSEFILFSCSQEKSSFPGAMEGMI